MCSTSQGETFSFQHKIVDELSLKINTLKGQSGRLSKDQSKDAISSSLLADLDKIVCRLAGRLRLRDEHFPKILTTLESRLNCNNTNTDLSQISISNGIFIQDNDALSVVSVLDRILATIKTIQKQKVKNDIYDMTAGILTDVLILWSDDISIIKRLCKVIGLVEKTHGQQISCVLSQWLDYLLECHQLQVIAVNELLKWSALLEYSKTFGNVMQPQLSKIIRVLSASLHENLSYTQSDDITGKDKTAGLTHHLHANSETISTIIKVCVQLLQQLMEEIAALVWGTDSTEVKSLESLMSDIVQILLTRQVSVSEEVSECMKLAGLALSLVVVSAPKIEAASATALTILRFLEKPQSDVTNIGNLNISIDFKVHEKPQVSEFGLISLINGILSVAGIPFLLHASSLDPSQPIIIQLCHILLGLCKSASKEKSFQILKALYKKASQVVLTHFDNDSDGTGSTLRCFDEDSFILKETLSLIWVNLESPIEGVRECIWDIFQDLLHLQKLGNQKTDTVSMLPIRITEDIVKLNWQVKGRYRLASLLIPHVGVEKLLDVWPSMWSELMKALSNHFLSQATAHVYKAYVDQIRFQWSSDFINKWKELCMPAMVSGLTSRDSICRRNISTFWLPWTLQREKRLYSIIQQTLVVILDSRDSDHDIVLSAWLALAKTGRSLQIHYDLDSAYLREALQHRSDDMRADAFSLICNSPKKAEALSPVEMTLLRDALPYNMNIDSAGFRHQIHSNILNMIVRLRGSSLVYLKNLYDNDPAQHQELCAHIEFLGWLIEHCIQSIYPGACFQRCKTALDWLDIILDSMTYQPHRKQNKGKTPETVVKLVSVARQLDRWSVDSPSTVHVLLQCVVTGSDEIQNLAVHIIQKYLSGSISSALAGDILLSALQLVSCPRSRQCESGSLLVLLIYEMFLLSGNYRCEITWTEHSGFSEISLNQTTSCTASSEFITNIMECVQKSIKLGETNAVFAADHAPAHGNHAWCSTDPGLILGVDLCVRKTPVSSLALVLPPIVKFCEDIIEMMMDILSGHSKQNAAPSFEDMGVAIEKLIGGDQQEEEECVTLTDTHQKVLSWAWLNLKVSCNLLCTIVHKWQNDEERVKQMSNIARKLIKVQTKCRHKGVIEACSVTLKELCTHLLQSHLVSVRSIPTTLLNEFLDEVCSENCAFSTTRRSAGLPLLMRAILAAYSSLKQHGALCSVLEKLFAVLDQPLTDNLDATRDVSQVHALHILKALFRDAGIAHGAQPYLQRALVYSIHGFSEPHWSIRNGATTLFGTVIWRMVGQKKSRDVELKAVTVAEFTSSFPAVLPCIGHYVQQAAVTHSLCPSVLPALTVLSQLSASPLIPDDIHKDLVQLRHQVAALAAHPMYGVRQLASSALPCLIGPNELWEWLDKLVTSLPKSQADICCSMNAIHGTLLQLQKLFSAVNQSDKSDYLLLVNAVMQRWWLADPDCVCPMICADYLDLVNTLTDQWLVDIPDIKLTQLWQSLGSSDTNLQVCKEQFLAKGLKLILNQCLRDKRNEDLRGPNKTYLYYTHDALGQTNEDLNLACVQHIHDNIKTLTTTKDAARMIMDELVHFLIRTCHYDCICITLDTIFLIWSSQPHVDTTLLQGESVYSCLSGYLKEEKGTSIAGLSLPVLGMVVQSSPTERILGTWCQVVEAMSVPEQTSFCRFQAARSLRVGASSILLPQQLQSTEVCYSEHIISIMKATFSLLQDEDYDVRQEASHFVCQLNSHIHRHQEQHLQSSRCLEIFCDAVLNNAVMDVNVIDFLCALIVKLAEESFMSQKSSVLYESEGVNIFAEKVVMKTVVHRCLKKRKLSFLTNGWLEQNIQLLDEAAVKAATKFHSSVGAIFNDINDSGFFAHVLGLLLYADLLISWSSAASEDMKKTIGNITTTCSSMLKMEGLHPMMRNVITEHIRIL